MDPSLYDQVLSRTVADYEKMLQDVDENDGLREIADFLDTQMTELVPTCQRYIELRDWGRKRLGVYYIEQPE